MPLMGRKEFKYLNKPFSRVDAFDKVTGKAKYAADLYLPHMLYGGELRSGYACARVVKINTEKAKAIPGVHAVVVADDLKTTKSFGMYMYLTKVVRYEGDVVAMVAAETKELVDQALKAIEVEYEELPAVCSIEEAMTEKAPVLHEDYPGNIFTDSRYAIRKGSIEDGFARADVVIEREYTTQFVEHAYLEPEAALACEDPADGVMTVYSSSQNPFITRWYVAEILDRPFNKVRIVQQTVGGSFGGKEESAGLVSARVAYLAHITGRPVKRVYTRELSFIESAKRHPLKMKYKIGAKQDGKIVALQGVIIDLSGAYNSQTQYMNWRGNAHSAGAYDIDNVHTDIFGVFANTVHSGAFRGYSSPQLLFAQEQLIEELGEELGLDPVEIRKVNCFKEGSTTATGQSLHNVLLEEIIDYHVRQIDFKKKYKEYKTRKGDKRRGIGMSICYRGCGRDSNSTDSSGTMAIIQQDGTVVLNTGLTEMGQGLKTAFAQIAAEALELPPESFQLANVNTQSVPDSGLTVSSRGTFMGGQSVKNACLKLKDIMIGNAAELFGVEKSRVSYADGVFWLKEDAGKKKTFAEVSNASLWSGKQLSVLEWYRSRTLRQDRATGQGEAFAAYAYGCVTAEVEVDLKTGVVELVQVTASHDVGTAVNPATIRGQIYGGIVMGQGFAVMEDVELDKGIMRTVNFDKYYIPTALDMPDMQINIFESDDPTGTYGAKSVAEPATEAVGAAIANAIYNATGRRIRNNPATLEEIVLGQKLR